MPDENKIYQEFAREMILRDYLARDRTKLANERTLLAYIRTFIGLLASGAGLVKLFEEPAFIATGFVLMAVSPVFLIVGAVVFLRTSRKLRLLDDSQPIYRKPDAR